MKSSFFEYHVASSGLMTARANLQVTSHNVANAETQGYSRQYAEQRASWPLTLYNGKGMIGTGSEVYGIGQHRDFYLDKKYWTDMGTLGEYQAKKQQLDITESIFNDLSDNGLSGVYNNLFTQLQSLSENSGNATYRTNLIQSANSLISTVKLEANALRKQQQDINSEIKSIAELINSIGNQIASLNRQIVTFENDGSRANDLRDSRARLVDKLSSYVNTEVFEKEMNAEYAAGKFPEPEDRGRSDKHYVVMINGYELVNHFNASQFTIRPREDGYDGYTGGAFTQPDKTDPDPTHAHNMLDNIGLYDIYVGGNKFDIYSRTLSGQLKGLVDVRDGNGATTTIYKPGTTTPYPYETTYKGIPYYMNKLNEFVQTLARAFNEGKDHDGKDIPGVVGLVNGHERNPDEPDPGDLLFFTMKESGPPMPITQAEIDAMGNALDYERMNIFNFALNPDIEQNPNMLGAALEGSPLYPSDESDNRVILGLLKLREYAGLFSQGKGSDFLNSISSDLGVAVKQASKFESNYNDVTSMVDQQRMSVSGVDINEEMINMVKYQQLYQAAAKLMNVIDSIYDQTVNRLGNF
ncbi:flagellar hook-associated protein 1 [Clostridia bacterium]|nr:flagellar hook-associated protein 1 [Clostridia bacterium]